MNQNPPVGRLLCCTTAKEEILVDNTVVGRAPSCELRLSASNVSGMHASILWKGAGWFVRDLSSRNGTFVGGRRIESGRDVAVTAGTQIAFGLNNDWMLICAEPPILLARRVGDGELMLSRAGLLSLGDGSEEVFSIFQNDLGQWVVEDSSHTSPINDGHALQVGGESWVVRVPSLITRTQRDTSEPLCVQRIHLHFEVSQDEEHVHVVGSQEGHSDVDLGTRSFLYLLLTLARIRLADEAQGLGEEEVGWVHIKDLCQMLASTESRINVSIHRLRRRFADSGVNSASKVIERRPYRGQLRLGVAHLSVGNKL